MVLNIYRNKISLKKEIVLTGGMVNNTYLEFKKRMFKHHNFKRVDECSTIGNCKLALMSLSGNK